MTARWLIKIRVLVHLGKEDCGLSLQDMADFQASFGYTWHQCQALPRLVRLVSVAIYGGCSKYAKSQS